MVAAKPNFSLAKKDGKTSANLICFAALYENLLRFTQPLSTQLPDREHAEVPITLSTYIMDVSGISVLQFWSLKSHIHTLAYLASAYYPETLGAIFIVGAPPFFSPSLVGSRAGLILSPCPRFASSGATRFSLHWRR